MPDLLRSQPPLVARLAKVRDNLAEWIDKARPRFLMTKRYIPAFSVAATCDLLDQAIDTIEAQAAEIAATRAKAEQEVVAWMRKWANACSASYRFDQARTAEALANAIERGDHRHD